MKRNNRKYLGWRRIILGAFVAVAMMFEAAYCQTNTAALLLQQTPGEGGSLTPEAGVHRFDLGASITLRAVPKPGYQFVYWMGDVSDPTSQSTIVHLNAPKIVVAVFERVQYEDLTEEDFSLSAPVGGLYGRAGDYSRGGYIGGGGPSIRRRQGPEPPEPDEPNDFPVPVPEPTTAVLLALGGVLACRSRRRNRQTRPAQL